MLDLNPINARLAHFAAAHNDTAPACLLDEAGAPSAELMEFRKRHNLTLDWIATGEAPQFRADRVSDPLACAYRLSGLLRVCARSLDGDAPEEPGDDAACAQTLQMAQGMLGRVIDALEASEARRGSPQGANSPAALFAQWQALRAQKAALVDAAGGNDPETPEWEEISERAEALCKAIASSTPDTDADAAAMVAWVMADSEGAIMCPMYEQAQTAVVAYLTANK